MSESERTAKPLKPVGQRPRCLAYGYRGNNRFCGLNCGYQWAVAHSRPQG